MSYMEDIKSHGKVITSFNDVESREVKKYIFNVMQNKQVSLSERIGHQYRFVNYIAQYAKFRNDAQPDETAEDAYKDGMKIALQSDAGEWLSGSGGAVLNAIENYERIFGDISVEEPMEARIIELKSGKNDKYKYVSLELV